MFSHKNHSLKRLFVTAGLLAASATLADSTYNAPGSACVATGSASLTVRDDGEAENRTASTVTAICPAERPIASPDTTTSLSGRVFAVDQNPLYDVCCRAVSKNPGAVKLTGAWQCTSGTSTGYQQLDLQALTDNYTFSSFFLECQVPAPSNGSASRIQMYRTIQQ